MNPPSTLLFDGSKHLGVTDPQIEIAVSQGEQRVATNSGVTDPRIELAVSDASHC